MGTIFSLAVLFAACSKSEPEISETLSETAAETSAETTASETTTTAQETTAAETEPIDTSGVEYIKDALQAEWHSVSAVNIYADDLNGDGVAELFVQYLFGAMKDGNIYVYDVSDGLKKLYEISARNSVGGLYTDENNVVHRIFWSDYAGSVWEENYAYFDITYDSIEMPFYVYVHDWFDGGAHVFDCNIYKNCEVVPTNEMKRNFDPEKAELVGTFEHEDIYAAFNDGEENEVSEIIQKEVFEGMTFVSQATDVYFGSLYEKENHGLTWDFDYFWQTAAPALAEIYGN
ncbi:MAG: hypothetical protein NC192_06320 [Muribaculaceae bacterium]|nr:hypothetical protein [Muribaculaceae bacterium]